MSAERMPQTDEGRADGSWLAAPLEALTRLVLRAPRLVLALAGALAVAAVLLSVRDLGFRTSRLDLLNPKSDFNQLWLEYLDEFGEGDDAVIVVRGTDREAVAEAIDSMAEALTEDERSFEQVLSRVELDVINSKGLYYLTLEELNGLEDSLDEIQPLLNGDWSQIRVDHQLRSAATAASDPTTGLQQRMAAAHLDRLSTTFASTLSDELDNYVSPWLIADSLSAREGEAIDKLAANGGRMTTGEGRMGFILLRLTQDSEQKLDSTSRSIARLRDLIAHTQEGQPDVTIGLTGLPIMEHDEMQASQSDMVRASVISLIGVACLFIAGLGGVRHPLLTVCTLLLAIAWSFGYITLAVGHLNILSVAFGVILIGLGIDFGIHYVARYLQLREESQTAAQAIIATSSSVGPGVFVGAVTTALAFFAAYFTQFTGVAELGVIAGGGILLCLLATIVVLPTLLYLIDYRSTNATPPRPLRMDRFVDPPLRYPMVTLFLCVLTTGIVAAGMGRLTYDHNLLNLQPKGIESVELERVLLNESDHSVWHAISVSHSRDELLARKEQFENLSSVDRTEEIVSLLPEDPEQKTPVIARIQRRLAFLPQQPPLIPVASPAEIRRELAAAGVVLEGNDQQVRATQHRLSRIGDKLVRMSDREVYERISALQQTMAGDLLSQLRALSDVSLPEPPSLDDLPASLVSRFVGKSEHHLLRIYGEGDIWDAEALETFVTDVKRIDPRVTGHPLQTYFASHQMQRSYINAAIYALAAVVVILLVDFRKFSLVALALLPVGAGMLQMFGVMGLLGIPLNPANMIALPLILGIGLDDGVHIVHDFRQQRGKYRVSASTATAIVVTTLTTMIGFGSLMLSSHQGLQSLGRVLTIGVMCCLLSSLVLLPALLRWMSDEGIPSEQAQQETQPALNTPASSDDPATNAAAENPVPRRRSA